jgi:DNA-binding MarR family transcriptional regulator
MARDAKDLSEAIIDFQSRFNDRISSAFVPPKDEPEPLTKSQVKALFLLFRKQGQTASELGDGLNLTRANLTGILDELEARGLARREAAENDRRKALVFLTDAGTDFCATVAKDLDAKMERRFLPLTRAERLEFIGHLRALTALLDKMED